MDSVIARSKGKSSSTKLDSVSYKSVLLVAVDHVDFNLVFSLIIEPVFVGFQDLVIPYYCDLRRQVIQEAEWLFVMEFHVQTTDWKDVQRECDNRYTTYFVKQISH